MSVFLKYKKESKSAFGGKIQLRLSLGNIDVGDECWWQIWDVGD